MLKYFGFAKGPDTGSFRAEFFCQSEWSVSGELVFDDLDLDNASLETDVVRNQAASEIKASKEIIE
jgi:hypothetical protein